MAPEGVATKCHKPVTFNLSTHKIMKQQQHRKSTRAHTLQTTPKIFKLKINQKTNVI